MNKATLINESVVGTKVYQLDPPYVNEVWDSELDNWVAQDVEYVAVVLTSNYPYAGKTASIYVADAQGRIEDMEFPLTGSLNDPTATHEEALDEMGYAV